MEDLLKTIPVRVILNPQAGLLGAATAANAEVRDD
jgi:glucokinase